MCKHSLLLVDDEPNILSALRRLLRREKYDLRLANSAEEALEVLAQEHIDLVITDSRMPGMDGIELLKQVKAKYPETVRIILSGYTDVSELAGAINEGEAYRFVLKPWNDDELKLTIQRSLEHHRLLHENQQLVNRISDQNEELRRLNANLEQVVEKKTRELLIQNRILRLSQEILDQLPVGVVGIDATGTIVQANRQGLEHLLENKVYIGSHISSHFCEQAIEKIFETIDTGQPGSLGSVSCYPLKNEQGPSGALLIALSCSSTPLCTSSETCHCKMRHTRENHASLFCNA